VIAVNRVLTYAACIGVLLSAAASAGAQYSRQGTLQQKQAPPTRVEGQILDKNKRPASQYPVTLRRMDPTTKKLYESYPGVTDFSGTFQFFDLQPGIYKVSPLKSATGDTIEVKGLPDEKLGILRLNTVIRVNFPAMKVMHASNQRACLAINAMAAKYIKPDAAKVISPEAARYLHPERAKVLTAAEAKTLTPEEARKPPAVASGS
jgi:hypothetical protein